MDRTPLVSIGVPTYNGERFIAESLGSLLAQDYPNIQILISDNASTDRTEQACRDAVLGDDRVRYERSSVNRGAAANFTYVMQQAVGPYFMWASDHDLWTPDFITACVSALVANPEAVLAYPETVLIDASGSRIEVMDDQIEADQASALARYKALIWRLEICNMIYGVGRLDAFKQIGVTTTAIGSDHLFLAELALRGPILRVGGERFLRRQNRPPETTSEAIDRTLTSLDPSSADSRRSLRPVSLYRELRDLHLRAIRDSSLRPWEQVDAYIWTVVCFAIRFGVAGRATQALMRRSKRLPIGHRVLRAVGRPSPPPGQRS